MFDRNVRGKLTRTQFIELMAEHMHPGQGRCARLNFGAQRRYLA